MRKKQLIIAHRYLNALFESKQFDTLQNLLPDYPDTAGYWHAKMDLYIGNAVKGAEFFAENEHIGTQNDLLIALLAASFHQAKRPSEKQVFRQPFIYRIVAKKAQSAADFQFDFSFLFVFSRFIHGFSSAILSKSRPGSEGGIADGNAVQAFQNNGGGRWSDVRYTIAKPISSAGMETNSTVSLSFGLRIRLLDRLTRTWRPRL